MTKRKSFSLLELYLHKDLTGFSTSKKAILYFSLVAINLSGIKRTEKNRTRKEIRTGGGDRKDDGRREERKKER